MVSSGTGHHPPHGRVLLYTWPHRCFYLASSCPRLTLVTEPFPPVSKMLFAPHASLEMLQIPIFLKLYPFFITLVTVGNLNLLVWLWVCKLDKGRNQVCFPLHCMAVLYLLPDIWEFQKILVEFVTEWNGKAELLNLNIRYFKTPVEKISISEQKGFWSQLKLRSALPDN